MSRHPQRQADAEQQKRQQRSPTGTLSKEPETGVLRIRLLGGFSVSVGAKRTIEENDWQLKKAAGLVKLLALAPRHQLHREQVMDLLWPQLNLSKAANNLRYTLHNARRALEPISPNTSHYLQLRGEQLLLYPQGEVWVDVEAFEEAAGQARRSR